MAATDVFPELPLFDLRLEEQDLEAVAQTLRSGWLTLGPRTAAFEEAFAAHLGARHAVALSSCTAALHLAYLAAGVGPDDEVIVPSFTFAATAAAALYCGATPGVRGDRLAQDPPSRPRGRRAAHHAAHQGGVRRALRRLRRRRRPPAGAVRRARDRADRGRRARPQRDARRTQTRHLGTGGRLQLLLQQGALGGRGWAALHRQRRGRRVRALAPLARDDERHLGPPPRPHRHIRRRRARLQLPPRRAARRAAALAPSAPGG